MPAGVGAINMPMTGEPYTMGEPARDRLKTLPLENNYFKMRHLRAPVAPQTAFATEQMIDELAYAAKMDPVEFRRQNIANDDGLIRRSGGRTCSRAWRSSRTGSRASPPRTCRAPTSSRAAGSRSATTRTRRPPASSRSR